MLLNLASFPDSLTTLEDDGDDTTQRRTSVRWDLNSIDDFEVAAKASTTSSTLPDVEFRRDRLDSRPEIRSGIQPQTSFISPQIRRPSGPYSLLNSNEVSLKKVLPKSHLSRVIIRDNLSAQRLFEMEMRASDRIKKKMSHLYDHLKKKFMSDQAKKMGRWRRESMNIQDYLDRNRIYLLKLQSQLKNPPP